METQKVKKGLDTFDKVVVLMLENRSFDNLLGYLYDEGVPEGKSYAGLQDCKDALPVPSSVKDYAEHKHVKPYCGGDYHQPYPDPGEVYQHVNTQIYNHIDEDNEGKAACYMKPPYNIPVPQPECPAMNGFISDYVNTLKAIECTECKDCEECKNDPSKCKKCRMCESFHNPGYDQYKVIMQCFKAEKVRILSTLAREFAVFDHWFCSVPSQTWCNRAFWHAGTSGGRLINPTDQCGLVNKIIAMLRWMFRVWSKPTLFQRMAENEVSHAVYPADFFSLTGLVNGPFKDQNTLRLGENLNEFKKDVSAGTLPDYSFIEPKFFCQHNDQHPSSFGRTDIDGKTRSGSVILGEHLIWDVYNTIQKSAYKDNTLLIITHDEHGGCFDHVSPPPSNGEMVLAPEKHMWCNEKGFDFKRLGIRVPMVMVSAYIEPNTIMNDSFDHTSFIKTMCEKWRMKGLTDRDKAARSFKKVFSSKKRALPDIAPPIIPLDQDDVLYDDDPLNELQHSILITAHSTAYIRQKMRNPFKSVPSIEGINTVKKATDYLKDPQIKTLLKGIL